MTTMFDDWSIPEDVMKEIKEILSTLSTHDLTCTEALAWLTVMRPPYERKLAAQIPPASLSLVRNR